MTIASETYRSSNYACNGSVVEFSVPFYILDESHIAVYLLDTTDGSQTKLTLTTHYTVVVSGLETGNSITTVSTYSSDYEIIIIRAVPFTQAKDYVDNDTFPAASHESGLDKITMLMQQLQEQLNRSIKFLESAEDSGISIPSLVGEAGKGIVVNTTEDGLDLSEVFGYNTNLIDNSIADTLHRHSELVASDGSPDPALRMDTTGHLITAGERIDINGDGSGNRYAYIDLTGDDIYTDYGLRIIRGTAGLNTTSQILHRGTGSLLITTQEAANINFATTSITRLSISSAGLVTLLNGTGINEFSTDGTLAGNSDDAVPTEKAVKTYVDTLNKTVQSGVTAFSTGGQASAILITSNIVEISVCAASGDSVKLPVAVVGLQITIINHGAESCDVFPNTDDKINEGAANAAKSVAANASILCSCWGANDWECVTLAR